MSVHPTASPAAPSREALADRWGVSWALIMRHACVLHPGNSRLWSSQPICNHGSGTGHTCCSLGSLLGSQLLLLGVCCELRCCCGIGLGLLQLPLRFLAASQTAMGLLQPLLGCLFSSWAEEKAESMQLLEKSTQVLKGIGSSEYLGIDL